MQCVITKENNFKQPGERYRSWAPDRYSLRHMFSLWENDRTVFKSCLLILISYFRQERFISRWVEALSDPRVTHEIRSIWVSYWSQVRHFPQVLFRSEALSNKQDLKPNRLDCSSTYPCCLKLVKKHVNLKMSWSWACCCINSCLLQADKSLGQKLASRLNVRPSMWRCTPSSMSWAAVRISVVTQPVLLSLSSPCP